MSGELIKSEFEKMKQVLAKSSNAQNTFIDLVREKLFILLIARISAFPLIALLYVLRSSVQLCYQEIHSRGFKSSKCCRSRSPMNRDCGYKKKVLTLKARASRSLSASFISLISPISSRLWLFSIWHPLRSLVSALPTAWWQAEAASSHFYCLSLTGQRERAPP